MLFEVSPSKCLSVSDVIQLLNKQVKSLGRIWVEAEVSSFKPSRSKHWYFDLKDEDIAGSVNCCMFYNNHSKLDWKPKVGDKVQVEGMFNIFRGNISFIITKLQLAGKGNNEQRLQELRKKLQEEGLFDSARKRPLPRFPKTVGVATSITSEALKDILKRLVDRMPGLTVYVADCTTEGEQAAPSIVSALELLQEHGKSEVLIVGRGGGSKDSLRAFDQENLVRAIADSSIPIVCAVGHEGDTCLADLVADVRAATPTHAAEAVTEETKGKVLVYLQQRSILLSRRIKQQIEGRREILRQMRPRDPRMAVSEQQLKFAALEQRFKEKMRRLLELRTQQLIQKRGLLQAMNPAEVLERGYSFTLKNGQTVFDAGTLRKGDYLTIQLASGKAIVRVQDLILEGDDEQLELKLGD